MAADTRSFAQLVDAFVDEELAQNPTTATALGITTYDGELPDLSAAAQTARRGRDDEWLGIFGALDDAELTADEAVDRELACSALRGRAVDDDWESWRRTPESYLGSVLTGVHLLFAHRLREEPELADAVISRLDKAADVLAAGRDNLEADLASPVLLSRFVPQALGAGAWLRDAVPLEFADETLRSRVAEAGARAADAMDSFGTWLADLQQRAAGPFAIGADRYSRLLKERDGLPYSAGELREVGRTHQDQLEADLAERAQAARGDRDWRAWLADLNDDHPADPRALLAAYADGTARSRAFCAERELVSFADGEHCDVVPSPPFQRSVLAVAAYLPPPAFSGRRTGTFWVPVPPDGASGEAIRQRMQTNSHSIVPTISAHETYPGHHWHLSWLAAQDVSRLRRVVWSTFFIEGWGLYAEQMMKEQGYFTDPAAEARQVDCRLFRAARIVVDTSLHAGDMTVDEAVAYMRDHASLSEETAKAEVLRYCSWPTQASSYLTGAIELQRIRDDFVARGGGLREFHDRVAGAGALPLSLVERVARRPLAGGPA
ncbi:MAG: hypothetical protein JWM93_3903 [Frankiales bacterium]|nr:hypothetical protein [Frankiales bacterium]